MTGNLTDLHNRVLWLETSNTEQDTVLGELAAKADYLFLRLNVLEGIDDVQSSEGQLRQLKMVFAGEEEDKEDADQTVPEFNQECLQIRNDTLQKANDGLYANHVAYRVASRGLREKVSELTAEVAQTQREHEAVMDTSGRVLAMAAGLRAEYERLFDKNSLLYGALSECRDFLVNRGRGDWRSVLLNEVEAALKNNGKEKEDE